MTLQGAQSKFLRDVARLIDYATSLGYELALGWGFRPHQFAEMYAQMKLGAPNSIHEFKLGIDFDLFIKGVYQTSSEAHRPLGAYWKSLDPDYRWGGDFDIDPSTPGKQPDGNHYSRMWMGRA